MKITNQDGRLSGRPILNRHLLFGLLAASIAAWPALKATAHEPKPIKTPPGNTVIATPSLGGEPQAIVVNAQDTFVYVSYFNTTTLEYDIAVIDTSSNTVTNNWSLGATVEITSLAISPDGTELYAGAATAATSSVVGEPTGQVAVIDVSNGSVTQTISVSGIPADLSVSPNGKLLYATTNTGLGFGLTTVNEPGSVAVINTKTQKVTKTIPIGGDTAWVVFNKTGSLAYVADELNASVVVIDTATSKVKASILVGGYDPYLVLNPAKDEIYALTITDLIGGTEAIAVIKGDKLINIVTPPTGDFIGLPGVTPNGSYAYVPVNEVDAGPANFVYLMDTTTFLPVGTPITVGSAPEIVVIAHNGQFAYVANQGGDGTISVIQISPAQ
jgi:YVTN family beta-propeller protein